MLVLMKENHSAFIVPAYDMDLFWHTHMAFPAAYREDTMRICGFVPYHDDR